MGEGLKEAFSRGILKSRSDVFVVSKVWATYTTRCELGLDKSLKALGLDYVDLYLVHWPLLMNPEGNDDRFPKLPDGSRDIIWGHNHVDTWKQMERLVATGKTKAIGVCNVCPGLPPVPPVFKFFFSPTHILSIPAYLLLLTLLAPDLWDSATLGMKVYMRNLVGPTGGRGGEKKN